MLTTPRNRLLLTMLRVAPILFGSAGSLGGQAGGEPSLLTVCDLLASPARYHGRTIMVVGRFRSTDEGTWLGEDKCDSPLITDGYQWPSMLWLSCCSPSAPTPPSRKIVVTDMMLWSKLAQVRKRTKLATQQVFQGGGIVRDGRAVQTWSGMREVAEQWAVVYGRFETQERLRPPKHYGAATDWGNGFGHLSAAPGQLVYQQTAMRLISDLAPPQPPE
jgi:hypothetical protein